MNQSPETPTSQDAPPSPSLTQVWQALRQIDPQRLRSARVTRSVVARLPTEGPPAASRRIGAPAGEQSAPARKIGRPILARRRPTASQPADPGVARQRLHALRDEVLPCRKCSHLAENRTQVVFGVGDPNADLMFVGEAPGADEDRIGEPFVGAAGKLLTRIIETMGFKRSDVYIANVLKCRPDMPQGSTGNRKPRPDEMQTCLPYLHRQIQIIRPKIVVALGATAVEGLLGNVEPMRALRGRLHELRIRKQSNDPESQDATIPVMVTYHPSYLLRNASNATKRLVWEDMLEVLKAMGITPTARQEGFFRAR